MEKTSETTMPASVYIGSNIYKKSNDLILSLSTPTLVSNKLMMICTMRLDKNVKGSLTATITASELKSIFGNTSNSFYDTIKKACYGSSTKRNKGSLLNYRVIIEDDENKRFSAHNLVTDAEFEKGILSVTFNSKMEKYITGMKNNYTCLNADEMMSMNSIYSYRLLEIFKQNMDVQEWLSNQNDDEIDRDEKPYNIQYEITKLKLMLNIIDGSNDVVLKTLKNKNNKIEDVEQYDETAFKEYSNFKRNVLEVAKKELEEKASIRFEYKEIKAGRGGKAVAIKFFIYRNEKNIKKKKKEEPEKEITKNIDDLIDELRPLIKEPLPTKDLRTIIKTADGNIAKVIEVYEDIQNNNTEIRNLTGSIIDRIKNKEKYSKPVSKKKKGGFCDIEEHEYDWEELEKNLISN